MPRIKTDTYFRGLTKPGIYSDGQGLYLRVQPSGSKSWVFIWRRFGTRREIGLGRFGPGAWSVSLAAARDKAKEARAIVGSGGDPKTDLAERKAAIRTLTLGEVAREYIEAKSADWRGAKTIDAWERFAASYIKPIAKIPIDQVGTEDVLRVIRPMWREKSETAKKVRERLKLVLDHAKARELREGDNPAQWKGHLDQILSAPVKLSRGHHAAMPYTDVRDFLMRLRSIDGMGAKALEFTVLTAARSGEVRGARWDEIDAEAGVWNIPAARMKTGKPHRVPLSTAAKAILEAVGQDRQNDLVFPGQRDKRPLSDMTLAKALRSAGGEGFTVHGFRSSFRDWVAEETTFQREVAEAALAHSVGDAVERAYRRQDALEKRRIMMQAWAEYIGGLRADDEKDEPSNMVKTTPRDRG